MDDNRVFQIIQQWPDYIKVDESARNEKYNICLACDFFQTTEKKCDICGCEMNLLTWSKSMGICPKGKFKGESL